MESVPTQQPAPGAVVAGIDGSSHDVLVLTAALAEAKLRKAPLHVRHCYELVGPSLADGFAMINWAALADADIAEKVLVVARETLSTLDPEWPVTFDHPPGRPENLLVEASEQATLVVVGTGRKSRLEEMLLGTVALSVAAHAACPVLVVPPGADPDGSGDIVVGVDGSRHSRHAVAVAIEEARMREARVDVLTTWNLEVVDGYVVTEPDSPEWRQVEERIQTMQESILADLDTQGVEVSLRSVKGGTRATLADASAGAAMVVVGNRGRGGFRSKALGSVTMDLLKRSTAPVLVVHGEQ